jgi:hypothetical protein
MSEKYYVVTCEGNQLKNQLTTKERAEDLVRYGYPLVQNQDEVNGLWEQYVDPPIDRGYRYYPELNTLFSAVLKLVVEDQTPVLISVKLQRKDDNV